MLTLFTKVVFSLPAVVCVDGNLSSVCTDYTQEKEPINKLGNMTQHFFSLQIQLSSQTQPTPAQITVSITHREGSGDFWWVFIYYVAIVAYTI